MVAAIRAKHTLYDQPKVFDDPFAIDFCNKRWQRILRSGSLPWKVMDVFGRGIHPISMEVIGRARYTEDLLDKAMAQGVTQYVILGAGFDSFALRRPDLQESLVVFEVDFPGTQVAKKSQMIDNYGDLPANLNFVGVNFERESLADGLARSTFDPKQAAFFSWLGTTMYLSHEATSATLSSMAEYCVSGSQIVFDYYTVPRMLQSWMSRPKVQRLATLAARQGEPFIGFHQPEEIDGLLDSTGLKLIENLKPSEQQNRYFRHRKDGVKTFQQGYFAHAEVA